MKFNRILTLAFCMVFLAIHTAQSQNLKGYNLALLCDSTKVIYTPSSACPNCYYYMPTNFRVAKNEAGQPEISLLKISETENDPITGGIMHLLLVWGLDSKQEAEAQYKIRTEYDSLANIIGAVAVDNPPDMETLSIVGDDALAKVLRAGLKGQSAAAVGSGTKMALSFRFDEAQITTMLEFIEKKKTSDAHFMIYLNCIVQNSEGPGSHPVPVRLKLNFSKLYPLFQ